MCNYYYADEEVWRAVQKIQCSSGTTITDVHGGAKYKQLKAFTSKGNITLTANANGVHCLQFQCGRYGS